MLFDGIVLPPAVVEELQRKETPAAVVRWLASRPEWVQVRALAVIDETLDLGGGECHAISLALELPDAQILLDDRRARIAARARGLPVSGTLGVLELAAQEGLIDVRQAIARLRGTSFRASEKLLRGLLDRHGAGQ